MYEQRLFSLSDLQDGFEATVSKLIRFPALDPEVLRDRVEEFIDRAESGSEGGS